MSPIFLTFFQACVVLLLAPLAPGLVRAFKAKLQGRRGASPFLPYIAFAVLLRKQMVISQSTSWVFRAAPFFVLGSAVFLALTLPLAARGGALAVYGNFMAVSGVLAVGAVFLVLGGLDAASAFGGMGASREMTLASLVEPSMIMVFAALSAVSGSFDVDGMLASGALRLSTAPYLALTFAAFLLILLAENARYPVDNPATHLELTMVHEAMILEYSGPYLAMMEYASALKLTVFSLLLAHFFVPVGTLVSTATLPAGVVLVVFGVTLKIIVAMFLLALLESTIAKMRFYRMQEYMGGAFLLSLAGMILALVHTMI